MVKSNRKKLLSTQRIMLNISGEKYETRLGTLEKFPETLLGDQSKRIYFYCPYQKEYYFDRNKLFFDAILFFYQSNGILQCPDQIPIDVFEEECRFFELPESAIKSLRPEEDIMFQIVDPLPVDDSHPRGKIWNIIQNPETSWAARYFAVFSLLMIVTSVATSCLETLPVLRFTGEKGLETDPWAILELSLNSWFLFELTLSMICTPNRKDFFTDAMTWFDIIAVLPYFIILTVSSGNSSSLGFLRIARLVRVGRLLRLSKHSIRIKIVIQVVKSSAPEFKALMICAMIVVIFGGTFMFYLEMNAVESHFTDIGLGMYWGVQTIATVGYGDIHPKTIPGMLFGSAFMTFGAMTLTIPVLTIITKFVAAYEQNISDFNP